MARGTPLGASRGAYRKPVEPVRPRRVDPELAAFEISPAEVFVTLAALVCDPDEHATSLVEQAGRRATRDTSLGGLLGDAIARAVYGDGQ